MPLWLQKDLKFIKLKYSISKFFGKNRRDERSTNTRIYKDICSNQAQVLCFFASFLCEKHQKKANELLSVKLVAFNGKLLLYKLMAIDARSFVDLDSLRMIFAVSLWSVP